MANMKTFFALISLSAAVLAAPSRGAQLLSRQTCKFRLAEASSSSIIHQDSDGWLYIGHTSHPVEEYSIDNIDQLRDPWNSACYINPEGQVKCSDVSPSADVWAIEESSSGDRLLVVNGGTEFLACDGDEGEEVWKEGKTGCREIEIKLVDFEGGC